MYWQALSEQNIEHAFRAGSDQAGNGDRQTIGVARGVDVGVQVGVIWGGVSVLFSRILIGAKWQLEDIKSTEMNNSNKYVDWIAIWNRVVI